MSSRYISLGELLETHEICIPIIQRDYIQGAEDKVIDGVRERLINDIIETLEDETKTLNLNIIYGVDDNKKIFYPIDGQQRLTTLYLFYWFLAMKAGRISEFKEKYKKFTYMTRTSAKEFFSILSDNTGKWDEDLQNIINSKSKEEFNKEIKDKIWFKYQWHSDLTIEAALNAIGDFLKLALKWDNECIKIYYNRLGQIKFHLLEEGSDNAELEASIRYVRMNARGRQLTNFENVKAILEIVEVKLDTEEEKNGIETEILKRKKRFGYKYDNKFIDVFYKRIYEEVSLDDKIKKMNEESVNFLVNVYNITGYIFNGRTIKEDKKYEKCIDYFKYYNKIYKISLKEELLELDKNFWREYFNTLKAILEFYYENKELSKYLNEIFEEIFELENQKSERLIAYIRYIYYQYIYANENVKMFNAEKIEKLDYVLDNLNYSNWKQKSCQEVDSLVKEIASYEDVFAYFSEKCNEIIKALTLECKDGQALNLKMNFQELGIRDIKQRFKEQSIKAKIIEFKSDGNYRMFEKLEKVFNCRKIQYLLYISDLWSSEVSPEKIEQLQRYISKSEIYFRECKDGIEGTNENELEWRKILAIAASWDKIDSCEEININAIPKSSDGYNIWHWKNEYYFWDDKENIQKDKLDLVRKAYDLLLDTDLIQVTKLKLENPEYDNCWLKYAINREYKPLLFSSIKYINNSLSILYEGIERNYFLIVLYFDLKKNIYQIPSKNVYTNKRERYAISFENISFEADREYTKFTFLDNKSYICYVNGKEYKHYDNRKYNMCLYGYLSFKIDIPPKQGNSFYYYDRDGKCLSEFVFYSNNAEYIQHVYSIKSIVEKIDEFNKKVKEEIYYIEKEEDKGKWDELIKAKYDISEKWIYYGGRTRDWYYSKSGTNNEVQPERIRNITGKLDSNVSKYVYIQSTMQ